MLRNISFDVEKNQRIGIVGRTGAGKSSIIQALFRIIEPELGSKYGIGGYNALLMGLHSLRQHISVIPQTPFLFKGTVRQNVDPFDTASEEAIWRALEEAGLIDHVRSVHLYLGSCPNSWTLTLRILRRVSQSVRSSWYASPGPC